MALTVADIRAASPAPVPFEVPEWGGTVYIRKLPLGLRFEIIEAAGDDESALLNADTIIRLVMGAVCGEDGKLLFGEADAEFLANEADAEVIATVAAEVVKVAGWTETALEDAAGN
jgi:hypothetical protein